MRKWVDISIVIIAFLISEIAVASGPKFPIYGIISNGQRTSYSLLPNDYKYLASTYKMLYSSFSQAVTDSLTKYNPSIDIIKYVNTAEYSNTKITANKIAKYKWIEENERRIDVAHYGVGIIKKAVSVSDSVISIYNSSKPYNKISSLVASSVAGNFSIDGTKYVCWIRIGNELMRINSITNYDDHRDISVNRGFGRSVAEPHFSGDTVFHPLYRSTGYPGKGTELCYFADPASTLRRDRTFDEWNEMKAEGQYNGIWMDVFGATIGVGPVTASGDKLVNGEIFDFISRKCYVDNSLMGTYNYRNLCQAYDSIVKICGDVPKLYANNINTGNYDGNQIFFQPYKGNKLIRMFCQESASTVLDIDAPFLEWNSNHTIDPQLGYHFAYQDIHSKWLGTFNNTRDAASKNNCIGPIVFQAGWKSQMFETITDSLRESIEMYHFAGYLMAIDSSKTCWLGETPLSATYSSATDLNGVRKPLVIPAWRWPVGTPTQTSSITFVDNTISNSPRVYGRQFSNGFVLVCPDTVGETTVNLANHGGPYYNPETGKQVASIKIQSHQGIVLLKTMEMISLHNFIQPTTTNTKQLFLDFNESMDIATLGVGIEIRELSTNNEVLGEWSQTETHAVQFTSATNFSADKAYKLTISKKINSDEGFSPINDTTIIFNLITENKNFNKKKEMKLIFYPNPTSRYITVNEPSISKLFLTDLTGKRIIVPQQSGKNTFDLNNVIHGNYILQVISNSGDRKHALITIAK